MADRMYPSSKPEPPKSAPSNTNPLFPPTKSQLYAATRPAYRPQPRRRRHSRSCYICLTFFLLFFLLATISAALYLLYRPRRPSFSISSLSVSRFNLTTSSHISSTISLALAARNPNKKLLFFYDGSSLSLTSHGVSVGRGKFPAFVHRKRNTTSLRAVISSGEGDAVDSGLAGMLRSELRSRSGLPVQISVQTKVRVKIGGIKTGRIRVRVICDGVTIHPPTGKSPAMASTAGGKCEVDLKIKIWNWTL